MDYATFWLFLGYVSLPPSPWRGMGKTLSTFYTVRDSLWRVQFLVRKAYYNSFLSSRGSFCEKLVITGTVFSEISRNLISFPFSFPGKLVVRRSLLLTIARGGGYCSSFSRQTVVPRVNFPARERTGCMPGGSGEGRGVAWVSAEIRKAAAAFWWSVINRPAGKAPRRKQFLRRNRSRNDPLNGGNRGDKQAREMPIPEEYQAMLSGTGRIFPGKVHRQRTIWQRHCDNEAVSRAEINWETVVRYRNNIKEHIFYAIRVKRISIPGINNAVFALGAFE